MHMRISMFMLSIMLAACAPESPSHDTWNAAEPTLQSAEDANKSEFSEQDLH